MRRTLFVTAASGLALLAVACGGGGSTATLAPGQTLAPGATAAPVVTLAPPPGGVVDVAALCAGQPTFSLNTPQPSFAQDEALNAKFPTQINGEPVTVQSSYWLQSVCYYGQGSSETIQRFAAIFPPASIPGISSAYGAVTIDGEEVNISGFRIPGTDANQIFAHLPEFVAAFGTDPVDAAKYQVAPTTIAGKSGYVVTDDTGDKTYHIVSGDTVLTVSGTDTQAATIFAAFP